MSLLPPHVVAHGDSTPVLSATPAPPDLLIAKGPLKGPGGLFGPEGKAVEPPACRAGESEFKSRLVR